MFCARIPLRKPFVQNAKRFAVGNIARFSTDETPFFSFQKISFIGKSIPIVFTLNDFCKQTTLTEQEASTCKMAKFLLESGNHEMIVGSATSLMYRKVVYENPTDTKNDISGFDYHVYHEFLQSIKLTPFMNEQWEASIRKNGKQILYIKRDCMTTRWLEEEHRDCYDKLSK